MPERFEGRESRLAILAGKFSKVRFSRGNRLRPTFMRNEFKFESAFRKFIRFEIRENRVLPVDDAAPQ